MPWEVPLFVRDPFVEVALQAASDGTLQKDNGSHSIVNYD